MPYLVFDDDPDKTLHVVRNLDTAPPRAIVRLQNETGWKLTEIRDQIQAADFLAPLLTSYLTAAVAGRPVTWDFLMDTPMTEWPWSFEATTEEKAQSEAGAGDAGDAQDPPQPSPSASAPDGAPAAEEWPPAAE